MTPEERLRLAAHDLAWAAEELLLVGGATLWLYVDAPTASQLRATEDVDAVLHLRARQDWQRFEASLRERGWTHDLDGPLCRFLSPDGRVYDFMPTDPAILGFSNRWYPRARETAERVSIGDMRFLVPTPVMALACKLEAWRGRGISDPFASVDIEDIGALLSGCSRLLDSARLESAETRRWIAEALTEIASNRTYRDALEANLPRLGDPAGLSRRVWRVVTTLIQQGADE